MLVKNILKLIKFDQLTTAQRAELAKILQKRRGDIDDALAIVNQALAKKTKSKRSSKG
jgi:hypothetical protein